MKRVRSTVIPVLSILSNVNPRWLLVPAAILLLCAFQVLIPSAQANPSVDYSMRVEHETVYLETNGTAYLGQTLYIDNQGNTQITVEVTAYHDDPSLEVTPRVVTQSIGIGDTVSITYSMTNGTDLDTAMEVTLEGHLTQVSGSPAPFRVEREAAFTMIGPAGSDEVLTQWKGAFPAGSCWQSALKGQNAILACSSGLLIVNISDPSDPFQVAFLPLPGKTWDVKVSGEYAYVASGPAGIQVVEISPLNDPEVVHRFATPGPAMALELANERVFVADNDEGLLILDRSQPTDLELMGNYNQTSEAKQLLLSGDLVYLADVEEGVLVINVSDPSDPTLVSSYEIEGDTYDMVLNDRDELFVSVFYDNSVILDVSDPENLTRLGSFDNVTYAYDITLLDDLALVAENGLKVVDVSDPEQPEELAHLEVLGVGLSLNLIDNETLLMPGAFSKAHFIDLSTPTNPTLISSMEYTGWAHDVLVHQDHLYLADEEGGLQIYGLQDPEEPELQGRINTTNMAYYLHAYDNTVIVADAYDGLWFVNVSDPKDPVITGRLNGSYQFTGMQVVDDLLFTTAYYDGFQIFNISNLDNITEVGNYGFSSYLDVTVQGDHAFVSTLDGLLVLDLTDPEDPSKVTKFQTAKPLMEQSLQGGFLHVANHDMGLLVFNISNPSSPVKMDSLSTTDRMEGLAVQGTYTFAANDENGLVIFNTAYPDAIYEAGHFDTPGHASRVALHDTYAYVADMDGQVQIVEFILPDFIPPSAVIGSPSIRLAYPGENVSFQGSGRDLDGHIIAYQWRSDLDGLLSQEPNFYTTDLSNGTHTIYFKVQDNGSHWSREVSVRVAVILDVPPPNEPPVASIVSITPAYPSVGENVSFQGQGTDQDGTVLAFRWTSNVSGELSTQATFSMAFKQPGIHNISFKVQDEDGDWSAAVSRDLTILKALPPPPNKAPTVSVTQILPTTIYEGFPLTFRGHAEDSDGTVVAYHWNSSLDGPLGNSLNLNNSNLSLGKHTISFMARDEDGEWSEPAQLNLEIIAVSSKEKEDDEGFLGLDLMVWIVLVLVLVVVGGIVAFLIQRSGATSPTQAPEPPVQPPSEPPGQVSTTPPDSTPAMATIECPGCQNRMTVPKLGRLQEVRCGSCGLSGMAEI